MKPVFGISITVEFSAAHHIVGYDGDCARPHGHNFKVVAEAVTANLSDIGIALDFKELKKILKAHTDRFDHQDLNTLEPFGTEMNPTAETISRYLFNAVTKDLQGNPLTSASEIKLKKITVWENERSSCSYGFLDIE